MGVGDPIVLSDEHAIRLRDALRAERLATEALELITLQYRTALHTARAARGVILDELADTYGFDSTTAHDFDFGSRTITRKG